MKKITSTELRKKNPSEFGKSAFIYVLNPKNRRCIYIIHLKKSKKYKDSRTPYGWESTVENYKTGKMLDCTPGVERPYYIDDFLNRN